MWLLVVLLALRVTDCATFVSYKDAVSQPLPPLDIDRRSRIPSITCSDAERHRVWRTLRRIERIFRWALSGTAIRERDEYAEQAFAENFIDPSIPERRLRLGTLRTQVRRRFRNLLV